MPAFTSYSQRQTTVYTINSLILFKQDGGDAERDDEQDGQDDKQNDTKGRLDKWRLF